MNRKTVKTDIDKIQKSLLLERLRISSSKDAHNILT